MLKTVLSEQRHVLEIGSGTGEHAVFFAQAMPHLQWQTSDLPQHHAGIQAWIDYAALPNVLLPLTLNVQGQWPAPDVYDATFTANTLHIMSWGSVEALFAGWGRTLSADARIVVYGPFNYGGRYTGEGNARFDASLRSQDPEMGIRDFEAVNALAEAQDFRLVADQGMPANNRCLVWRRYA